jgi:hypothetical protein
METQHDDSVATVGDLRSHVTIISCDDNNNEFHNTPLVFGHDSFATILKTTAKKFRETFFKLLKRVPDKEMRAIPSEISVWMAAFVFEQLGGCYAALVAKNVEPKAAAAATFGLFGDTFADLIDSNLIDRQKLAAVMAAKEGKTDAETQPAPASEDGGGASQP